MKSTFFVFGTMKKDNSNNLGHENALYSCKVFQSKVTTTGNGFDVPSKHHNKSLSLSDEVSHY